MPSLEPSDRELIERANESIERLKETLATQGQEIANLRAAINVHRKAPKPPGDVDRLIIQGSLVFIAAMVGVMVHRAVARNIYPSITELGAIGASILLLRTDKATAADVSSSALRRVLGIDKE